MRTRARPYIGLLATIAFGLAGASFLAQWRATDDGLALAGGVALLTMAGLRLLVLARQEGWVGGQTDDDDEPDAR